MIETISVSSRGQIVIPEKMRKLLGIKDGSRLVLVEKNDEIIIKRESEVEIFLEDSEKKESVGWMMLAEKSMKEIWDNPKDDKVWNQYLNEPEVE